MNFFEIAAARYSCRRYDTEKTVEPDKLNAVLNAAVLAPSACNGQPYHITVCKGELAKQVAHTTTERKINTFVDQAPILLILSEKPYTKLAGIGAKLKKNDYRSMDIGILAAYLTAEATAQGLGSCIIGWLDSDKIRDICGIKGTVRLIISLGYALDEPQPKKRKKREDLITEIGE